MSKTKNGEQQHCCLGVACRELGYAEEDVQPYSVTRGRVHQKFYGQMPWMRRPDVRSRDQGLTVMGALIELNDASNTKSFKKQINYLRRVQAVLDAEEAAQ